MRSLPSASRYAAGLAMSAGLTLAAYWSLRLACADRLFHSGTRQGVAQALRLAPANAEYHARLAHLADYADPNPQAALSALEAAVALNPRLSAAWMDLGLRAEMDQQPERAEKCLLQAVRVDRTYKPIWTLTNFYFRRNDAGKFWPTARHALQTGDIDYYDPAPLFQLCWRMTPDPAAILQRAIPHIGRIQARYLSFLLRQNLLGAAAPVAERVLALAGDEDLSAVFAYCDRLLETADVARAVPLWNALGRRMLRPCQPLAPDQGVFLTNGNFISPPVPHGFDWRFSAVAGVSVDRAGSPPVLRISFDGNQPERCEVLAQLLPLAPGRHYLLRFRYQTDAIQPGAGLRWRLLDAISGAELPSKSDDLASDHESEGTARFSAPPDLRLARLALVYRRALGTVSIEGWLALGPVTLELAP